MWVIISAIIFFVLLYTVVPYFLSRGLGVKVFKRGRDLSKVAFTFDDGPNPIYTPILLDLLKENNEGQLIGIHNYLHHTNWFMSPWKVRKGLEETAKVIEAITGVTPIYYRPPWGMLNLFDFVRKGTYKIILWSIMADDWRTSGGSEKIKHRLAKIKGGDVILLHDCGDTFGAEMDASRNTINALKDVLKTVKKKGFTCVRVDELLEKL